MTIFDEWQAGDITDTEALRSLTAEYDSIDAQYTALEEMRDKKRAQLEAVMGKIGGQVELPGFGLIEITQASQYRSYGAKQLDALVYSLMQQGDVDTAQAIEACGKDVVRKGGIRITREKH